MIESKNNIGIADEKIQVILKDHKLKYGYEFVFPKYRQLPDEVLLALRILKTHGLEVSIILVEEEPASVLDKK